jgi:pSer/pThr/pTyr-binding forkhead associated (FHA) protein
MVKPGSGKLKVISRGSLVTDQAEIPIGETLNIGRSEGNDIMINETTVSFEHACIAYYSGEYLLSDLKSTNGTLHNDVRLRDDSVLRPGDTITIGNTIFQFEE